MVSAARKKGMKAGHWCVCTQNRMYIEYLYEMHLSMERNLCNAAGILVVAWYY